jgi:plastocyanin
MALQRPSLRRAVIGLAAAAAAAGVAVPSAALTTSRHSTPYDAAWVQAATHAAWHQFGDPTFPAPPVPPLPTNRASGWAPQPAGTTGTINLDFGPYVVEAGTDLSRIDFTPAGATGFTTEVHTFVLNPDGTKVAGNEVHTHHVHLLKGNPNNPQYLDWLYGTGEEMTGGSIAERAKADPKYGAGRRYGIPMTQGSMLGELSMLHNMTSETRTVYIRFQLTFVYGSRAEIKQAKHLDFHPLTPQIFGGTFNVPRTGGAYAWPVQLGRDVKDAGQNHGTMTSNPTPSKLEPGVGVVWTAPYSGTIVVSAGHLHAGGTDAVLSNLGSKAHPCPQQGLSGYPGTTLLDSRVIGHHGVWPTNDYQMGLSQYDWRAYVHKGDRLAINGGYLPQKFSFPDAMVFAGVYVDQAAPPPPSAGCAPFLAQHPHASWRHVIRTNINHPWSMYPDQPTCSPCDHKEARPKPGPATDVVQIADMQYLPGNGGNSGLPNGPPVVTRGDTLQFVNEDYADSLMRHTVSSCNAPCNGAGMMTNYPFLNGQFESGVLGYMWEDAYVSTSTTPQWSLDTRTMKPGYYTFFCRIHPFMRGDFYVAPKSARTRAQIMAWWHSL